MVTSRPMNEELVAAAIRLLTEQGPQALQVRRLAGAAGTSTMAVYTHFGGLPEVVKAVASEGFARLSAHLAAVPQTDDCIADLYRLALAYRQNAIENPHLYRLMFGLSDATGRRLPAQDLTTSRQPGDLPEGRTAFSYLFTAAERAIESGRLRPAEPMAVAAQLWSALHGYVLLEMAGYFGGTDAGVAYVLAPLGMTLATGLGDKPELALQSAAAVRDALGLTNTNSDVR